MIVLIDFITYRIKKIDLTYALSLLFKVRSTLLKVIKFRITLVNIIPASIGETSTGNRDDFA